MPEGDTLRRVAERLQVLVGHRVSAESPNPRGLATGVARAVDGRTLEAVEARGKNLLLRFEGGVVVRSHLRMTGRWRVVRAGSPRAGLPWLVLHGGGWEAAQWNGPLLSLQRGPLDVLGPDLLADETDVGEVVRHVRWCAEPAMLLGEALLEQRLVAGIGNMWLAESLWNARVSPWRPLAEVDDEELERALAWARTAMHASVSGERPLRAVYRRAGRGCHRCGTPIASRGLGERNRTAYWCPVCQSET